MPKITFMGAGSAMFAKNILGDALLTPALKDSHIALYDIDRRRLEESLGMMQILNKNLNSNKAKITAHLGIGQRKYALKDANYIINAIQVGGYKPSTVIDFEIPKKYGLHQTIGDTLGIGGIFRALRTIPVMFDFAKDIEKVCPDAWLLNYTNPMSMISGAMQRFTSVKTVGLCHSVQVCASSLLGNFEMLDSVKKLQWKIAGINHMAWLLEITDDGKDLYPEIKRKAEKHLSGCKKKGGENKWDMVRLEMMLKFGYYMTESSEHNAEYTPYWIKSRYPELIQTYDIPLDEYPRRCVKIIEKWKEQRAELIANPDLSHKRTNEYGAIIMEAMETDIPVKIGGNVINTGLITNLPSNASVEVPCLVDRSGVQGCYIGDLPEQCAALNRTNINVHLLAIQAALTGKKEHIYHATMLDPHTSAELSIDDMVNMCDDIIKAHGKMLPKFK